MMFSKISWISLFSVLQGAAAFTGALSTRAGVVSTSQLFEKKNPFIPAIPNPFDAFQSPPAPSKPPSREDFDSTTNFLLQQAKRLVGSDLGLYEPQLLDDTKFIWISPTSDQPLGKTEYLAAGRFFDLRGAFPDLDFRAHDFRVDEDDPFTIRVTFRTTGTMRGQLRLRTEVLPPTGQTMRCPPEAITIQFDADTGKVVKLCTGFGMDRLIGNTAGTTGVTAASIIAGKIISDWDLYPPTTVIQRFFGRPVQQLSESSSFLAPFPETVMIQLAKGILSTNMAADDPSLLALQFTYCAPTVGPIKKGEYLEKYARQEFQDIQPRFSNFRVDPYDPVRVWVDASPTAPGYLGAPMAMSFSFDEDGFCTRATSGAIMDPSIGNGGGLTGREGFLYALGKAAPDLVTRPLPRILGRARMQVLSPLTGLGPDDYVPSKDSTGAFPPVPPATPSPPKEEAQPLSPVEKAVAAAETVVGRPSFNLRPSFNIPKLGLPEKETEPKKPQAPLQPPRPSFTIPKIVPEAPPKLPEIPKPRPSFNIQKSSPQAPKKSEPAKPAPPSKPRPSLRIPTFTPPEPKAEPKKPEASKPRPSLIVNPFAASGKSAEPAQKPVSKPRPSFTIRPTFPVAPKTGGTGSTQSLKAQEEARRKQAELRRKQQEQERIAREKAAAESAKKAEAERKRVELEAQRAAKQAAEEQRRMEIEQQKAMQKAEGERKKREAEAKREAEQAARAAAEQRKREAEERKATQREEAELKKRQAAEIRAAQLAEAERRKQEQEKLKAASAIKAAQQAAAKKAAQEAAAKKAAEEAAARKAAQDAAARKATAERQKVELERQKAKAEQARVEAEQRERQRAAEQSLSRAQARATIALFSFGEKTDKEAPAPRVPRAAAAPSKTAPVGVPTVSRWKRNSDGSITGLVSGSRNFEEGERITTSPIARGNIASGEVVTTGSGSRYFLD